jgi:DNA-binding response OmpR family regulator
MKQVHIYEAASYPDLGQHLPYKGVTVQLLLVEGDCLVASLLASSLELQHWKVTIAHDGRDALRCLESAPYKIVVMDWTLPAPGPSGLELCQRIRRQSSRVGIVFATAREALQDRLLAFKAGADDYLIKPFQGEELAARVSAVYRRAERQFARSYFPQSHAARFATSSECWLAEEHRLRCESIVVDLATLRVTVEGREIDLPLRQLLILMYLLRRRGSFVSEVELRERVLRTSSSASNSTVRNHIHQLRDRLGPAGSLIFSAHGRGYGIGSPRAHPIEQRDAP